MKISRRDAIVISGSTLAGLSLRAGNRGRLQAQAAPPQQAWPDQLVEQPLREGFPAPLPLNPDGSAPEHPASEAGSITAPLMLPPPNRQAPETEFGYKKPAGKVGPRGPARPARTLHFSYFPPPPAVAHTALL